MTPYYNVVGDEAAPRFGFLLHGVLGAGHNLRSFAKRLTEARPDYRFALIDLRYHGRSLGAPAPHGLEPAVDDLFDLVAELGRAPQVVLGHSLGGKVALSYAQRHVEGSRGRSPEPQWADTLRQVWTLDSDPGAQQPDSGHEVEQVMSSLRAHPGPFASRSEAVDALIRDSRSSSLAQWLATSLEKQGDSYVWRYEVDRIELLLADYFAKDMWPFLDAQVTQSEASAIVYDLLVAEHSNRWSGSMKERAELLTESPTVRVHTLQDSGHWVHVDNPHGLVEILAKHLL